MPNTSNSLRSNLEIYMLDGAEALIEAEQTYRNTKRHDYLPWANNVSYMEIATEIIPDRSGIDFNSPLYITVSFHNPIIGAEKLCENAIDLIGQHNETLRITPDSADEIQILSIYAGMEGPKLKLVTLCRSYGSGFKFFKQLFYMTNDALYEEIDKAADTTSGRLVIPEDILKFKVSDEETSKHNEIINRQNEVLKNCSKEHPFLNSIEEYEPCDIPSPADNVDFLYDLLTDDMKIKTYSPYDKFNEVFRDIMRQANGTEKFRYISVMKGEATEESFLSLLKTTLINQYVNTGAFPEEDVPVMMEKLRRSLFEFYVIQDLIDDPNITDIKITGPHEIRTRYKGKAYISNISFIDEADYIRFIDGICYKNGISQKVPIQTFTDTRDKNYILRLTLSARYINSVPYPYIHFRKIDRNKLLSDELIRLGFMTPKIRDYLKDCGKNSRGVVFAGPPGSGKTVALNWFLEEAYEQSAEILVIQENDEIFTKRKGVMLQHVVHYANDNEIPVDLEQLGQLALVAGANVFVIGEVKGAEICSAITLSNSGCRTAITIHTPSSTETINKMADLAMRGYANDIVQAKRELRSFQTIVYIDSFKITEISEIIGFNEDKQDMDYKYIYRRSLEEGAQERKYK